jgi:outer membrane protein assembly factor BamB
LSHEPATTVFAPAVTRDLVVAGSTTFVSPSVGVLVAIDRVSGRRRWQIDPLPSSSPAIGGGVAGPPVAANGRVFAACRDGTIVAVDTATGAVVWTAVPVTAGATRGSTEPDFRPLAVSGPTLFAGSLTGVVVAYDVTTGHERWRRAAEFVSTGFQIAADDPAVSVPHWSGVLIALDVRTGAELWRMDDPRVVLTAPPAAALGQLFLASSTAGFVAVRWP